MQLDGRATVSKLEVWVRFPPSAPILAIPCLVVEPARPPPTMSSLWRDIIASESQTNPRFSWPGLVGAVMPAGPECGRLDDPDARLIRWWADRAPAAACLQPTGP